MSCLPPRSPCVRSGISLVEALVAMTITATAGAALLTSIGSAMGTSRELVRQTVARGLGDQLMDEIAAAPFPEKKAKRPSEKDTRQLFDDLDDYDGWSDQPPTTRNGELIGQEGLLWRRDGLTRLLRMRANTTFLARFRRHVLVEPIVADTRGGWRKATAQSDLRRVTIRVDYIDAEDHENTLYSIARVFAYVPFSS